MCLKHVHAAQAATLVQATQPNRSGRYLQQIPICRGHRLPCSQQDCLPVQKAMMRSHHLQHACLATEAQPSIAIVRRCGSS